MKWTWEKLANYCEDIYGVYVDRDERFFICPECDEPIYEYDWKDDWQMSQGLCPVCEFDLIEEEEEQYACS